MTWAQFINVEADINQPRNYVEGTLQGDTPGWTIVDAALWGQQYSGWRQVPEGWTPPVALEEERQEQLNLLKKQIAPVIIYEQAPEFKQRNAALGVYPVEVTLDIIGWIQAVRCVVAELEAEINDSQSLNELEAVDIEPGTVRSRAEAIMAG